MEKMEQQVVVCEKRFSVLITYEKTTNSKKNVRFFLTDTLKVWNNKKYFIIPLPKSLNNLYCKTKQNKKEGGYVDKTHIRFTREFEKIFRKYLSASHPDKEKLIQKTKFDLKKLFLRIFVNSTIKNEEKEEFDLFYERLIRKTEEELSKSN